MIIRPTQLRPIPGFLLPFTQSSSTTISAISTAALTRRLLHQRASAPRIPSPTPFVPDTATFLSLIGRNLSQHASKIPTWEALFSLTSPQLKELGVEPPRARRYLLRWRDKFRHGEYGIGGDLRAVQDGQAELRVVEVVGKDVLPAVATVGSFPGSRKVVVNAGQGEAVVGELRPVKGVGLVKGGVLSGPYVQVIKGTKGTVGTLSVKEGMWEVKRGKKIDGGERRQAEVRAKRRSEQRRTTRG